MSSVCPSKVLVSVPLFTFHILIVLSADALAKQLFSTTTKSQINLSCPVNVCFTFPSAGSQIFIVPSKSPVTRSPLGSTANAETDTSWISLNFFLILPKNSPLF